MGTSYPVPFPAVNNVNLQAVGLPVRPAEYTGSGNGEDVDFGLPGVRPLTCFLFGEIGSVNGDSSFTTSVEESDDELSWTPIVGTSWAPILEENLVTLIRFTRTKRFLRTPYTVTGGDSDLFASVGLGTVEVTT